MSLYDDDDDVTVGTAGALGGTGWSKGATWAQTQHKQNSIKQTLLATNAGAKKDDVSAGTGAPSALSFPKPVSLPPVINLEKSKRASEVVDTAPKFYGGGDRIRGDKSMLPMNDPNWTVVNEYSPMWPNDYYKVVKEMSDAKRQPEDDWPESKRRRYTEKAREKSRDRFYDSASSSSTSGFGRVRDEYSDDEDDDGGGKRRSRGGRSGDSRRHQRDRGSGSGGGASSSSGAAIAPPPSLTESSSADDSRGSESNGGGVSMLQKLASTPASGLGVAAKIMAKYGYKHGQGLGAQEQGMSSALSVEKTSKRGGRIIHERDRLPPPPVFTAPLAPSERSVTPPTLVGEYGEPDSGEGEEEAKGEVQQQAKQSITDIMRNPSKVVVCKNMVGPGEVDDDLEPEIKDECNTKYGDVNKVVIFELKNVAPEEAVRIFVEFKRVETAVKAVVDLNGRFFGGRQVAASFYDFDKFTNLQLMD